MAGVSDEQITSLLRDVFSIEEFRSSQLEIVKHLLSGKHALVVMPTGMGKSLCYQLPALMLDGLTVVLSPLIALMKDQVDSMKQLGIDAEYINSSLSGPERNRRYKNIAGGKYKIVLVAPERFRKKEFLEVVHTRKVSLLAIDEAHCVSQWGHDFRPDYSRVSEFRELLGGPVTIALTATAAAPVRDDIIRLSGMCPGDIKVFNEGICRPNLHLSVIDAIDETEKFDTITELLLTESGSRIVYFRLIQNLEKYSRYLQGKGLKHLLYHGKLDPARRRSVQNRFLHTDSLMLATNAFGMGIDKSNIRMIVHAEVPDSIESYYQEIGRAGRDGRDSRCVLVYNEADLAVQIDFLEWRNPDASFIKKTWQLLTSLAESLNSYDYEELQEQLVYKNRGDHRLQTVLNIFDRFGVTSGTVETHSLKLLKELPDELVSEERINTMREIDRQRLIAMLNYAKSDTCRRQIIHQYFDVDDLECGNCDYCV